MAYIGNTVQNQGFTPAIDYFNGNGVTVTFTLSRPVVSVAQLIVAVDNVIQNPSSAFTVSGNSITFTSAPLSGTNNIWVEYTSLITQYNAISQDPSVIGDITASGGYLAEGDFGNTFIDGTIVDYVTGIARITTGPTDGITLYNGGTSARNPLMTLTTAGNAGIGTITPGAKLEVNQNLATYSPTGNSIAILNNPNSVGQSPLDWRINGTLRGRIRVDFSGNMNYVTNGGSHFFVVNGDINVGSVAMNVDSAGRVVTPFQPAFSANGSGGTVTVAAGALVPFNNVILNVGSHYNASTFLFTAPVTGVYWFNYSLYIQGASSFTVQLNGAEMTGTSPLVFIPAADQFDQNGSASLVVQMSAGDTFGIRSRSTQASILFTPHSRFSGYLLG